MSRVRIIPLKDDPDSWAETIEQDEYAREWDQWNSEVAQKEQQFEHINSNVVLH